MTMQMKLFRILPLLVLALLCACTDPYALQTNNFESALVIEATITNELKPQKIKITRTYVLEENSPVEEPDATVTVTDSDGNTYNFDAVGGQYVSTVPFAAAPGKTYRLGIVTREGKTYVSDAETLTTVNPMNDIVASVATKNGQRGVQINAQSFDPANSSKYYRYEYEETYKIIAPNWATFKAILGPPEPPEVHESIVLVPQDASTQVCYATQLSNTFILSSSTDKAEDREDFTVRFIPDNDAVIQHRYSILVRQYIQSLAAYQFYKTLNEISGSGSVFSPTQPGFFYGNLRCVDNPDEKVVGFFDVASVSSKRIFFNYVDLFPGEPLPPYFIDCAPTHFNYCFDPMNPECNGAMLILSVRYNSLLYFSGSTPTFDFVPPPCADCTKIGSNEIPSFWE